MTDWAATGQMLSGIGTIGGAIALIAVAYLGKSAVADFEMQRQTERRMEHAENALTVAYQIQSAVESIRSPMSTASELDSAREEIAEQDWFGALPEARQSRAVQANVIYQRIRFFQDVFDKGLAALPFVKAYFGPVSEGSMRDLLHARHSVRVYADAYMRDQGHDPAHTNTVESHIWEGWGNPDPVKVKISDGISQLESVLLPLIKGPNAISAIEQGN